MNRELHQPQREKWLILKGLRQPPLSQAEIDAFVKLYVKTRRDVPPPEPPEAA